MENQKGCFIRHLLSLPIPRASKQSYYRYLNFPFSQFSVLSLCQTKDISVLFIKLQLAFCLKEWRTMTAKQTTSDDGNDHIFNNLSGVKNLRCHVFGISSFWLLLLMITKCTI